MGEGVWVRGWKEKSMLLLKALGFFFIVAGALTVFGARWIVNKYSLDKNAKCDFENEMGEEEIKQYKLNKALVNIKLIGMAMTLPGIVIILIIFR